MRRTGGFTLIELLVTLAVIGAALSPVILLQIEANARHRRQTEQVDRLTATRNALALLRTLNPWATPVGTAEAGPGLTLMWTARAISAPRRSLRWLGGEGAFDVALYHVEARLVRTDGREAGRFSVEQVGWRKLRQGRGTPTFAPAR